MSQDGHGNGPDAAPGPSSWRPDEPGPWATPTSDATRTGQATEQAGPGQPPYQPYAELAQAPYQPYAGPVPAPYQPYATPGPAPYEQDDAWSGPQPAGYPQPGYPPSGFGQPGYGPPGFRPMAEPPRTPAIAVVGLVLSLVLAPVGLVVSLVALGRTRRAGAGRGLAVAGSIIGAALLVMGVALGVALVPRLADLAEPRSTVLRFAAAVDQGTCDDFMASSTRALRADGGITTCDDFDAAIAGNGYRDNQVLVTGVSLESGVATVSTIETYLWLEDGQTYTDRFVYRVVKEDGAWRVDAVDPADQ